MSSHWTFYSFDDRRFQQLFGGGSSANADALADFLTQEDYFDFDDPDRAAAVARRVVAEGFSYKGADDEQRDILDCIPSAVFNGSETLGRFVNAQPESPQGLHINVVQELRKRAGTEIDTPLLSLFNGGRRLGDAPAEYCEYIVFTPAEVTALLAEVRRIVELDTPWSHPDFPAEVENELLGPLESAAQADRGLAAFYP